jgi:hypothetical protein
MMKMIRSNLWHMDDDEDDDDSDDDNDGEMIK